MDATMLQLHAECVCEGRWIECSRVSFELLLLEPHLGLHTAQLRRLLELLQRQTRILLHALAALMKQTKIVDRIGIALTAKEAEREGQK